MRGRWGDRGPGRRPARGAFLVPARSSLSRPPSHSHGRRIKGPSRSARVPRGRNPVARVDSRHRPQEKGALCFEPDDSALYVEPPEA